LFQVRNRADKHPEQVAQLLDTSTYCIPVSTIDLAGGIPPIVGILNKKAAYCDGAMSLRNIFSRNESFKQHQNIVAPWPQFGIRFYQAGCGTSTTLHLSCIQSSSLIAWVASQS
jgi:hypothetical protein